MSELAATNIPGATVLAGLRVGYDTPPLEPTDLAPDWHTQLGRWLRDAMEAGLTEPNAMVLATADEHGYPSSRTVLCKGLDERGVVFYTNYTSAKNHDLRATGHAAATFLWLPLHRQVHVRGDVKRVSEGETAAYWRGRPRGSQLGAWASPQSAVVRSRADLDRAWEAAQRRFPQEVPVPPHWGGLRILPTSVEFWQGRADRMHDRLRYRQAPHGGSGDLREGWLIERLAP